MSGIHGLIKLNDIFTLGTNKLHLKENHVIFEYAICDLKSKQNMTTPMFPTFTRAIEVTL